MHRIHHRRKPRAAASAVGALLLCVAAAAHGAKCLPDDDFDQYPSGEPGYNRQTGQPYFNVGINSRFAESDDSDIDELIVDDSLGETAPPLHWRYKTVKFSWLPYKGPDGLEGYSLQRADWPYDKRANAAAEVLSETTVTRPNHASSYKEWNVYRIISGARREDCLNSDRRLILESDLDFEMLSYVRTDDGFLTSMHDVIAPVEDGRYPVPTFNPAENPDQVSALRLINANDVEARVTIVGHDDAGDAGGPVSVTIPAGSVKTLTATELEGESETAKEGDAAMDGAFGDGVGKWRLRVASEVPVQALNLLSSPTGHLTNLCTAPDRAPQRPRDAAGNTEEVSPGTRHGVSEPSAREREGVALA